MKITKIEEINDEKPQMDFKVLYVFNEDGAVPVRKDADNPFFKIVDFEYDKIYCVSHIFGIIENTIDFIVFLNYCGKKYKVVLNVDDLEYQEISGSCNLEEKNKVINGLKQHNTVIFNPNIEKVYYENFPNQKLVDEFNIKTEEEYMSTFINRDGELDSSIKHTDIFSGQIYCHYKGKSNFAVEFVEDEFDTFDNKVKVTNFTTRLEDRNHYSMYVHEAVFSIRDLYEEIRKSRTSIADLAWSARPAAEPTLGE